MYILRTGIYILNQSHYKIVNNHTERTVLRKFII